MAGHFFNSPVHLHYSTEESHPDPLALTAHHGLLAVENAPNVILETVKRSDDDDLSKKGDTHIILRLYEAYGGHAQAKLRM